MTYPGPSKTAAYYDHLKAGRARRAPTKVKRVPLAVFLSGISAVLLVALAGAGCLAIINLFGLSTGQIGQEGFFQGAYLAAALAALNWFIFYLTVPLACLGIGIALARKPGKKITSTAPYLRDGAIAGGICVSAVTSSFGMMDGSVSAGLGASFTGLIIGALAGLCCAAIFIAIVRPAQQIKVIDTSVF
ncbi:MAG: hypothetical protein AAGK23_09520 [Pseudomonadota bacterium]